MLFGLCSPKYIAMMNGEYCQDDYEDEGSSRLHLIKSLDIPRKQLMRIAEAALIRYFDPPYNKLLKNSFPSSNLKLLKECYNYDFNAVITEVNTEAINCFIYSQKVPTARNHHIAKFDLHSEEERLSFFQY